MPRKKMWVEWGDGSELSPSRKKPGEYSPLTREDGTNQLGQVTLSPIDEDEEHSLRDPPVFIYVNDGNTSDSREKEPLDLEDLLELAELVARAIIVLDKAMPHIKGLWNDQALPAVKSAWNRVAGTRWTGRHAESIAAKPSQEVIVEFEEPKVRMSKSEARERFTSAFAARLFSENQLRILRNAQIEDDVDPLRLEIATETLTAQQVGDRIRLMLEANPSLVSEETLAEIGEILGRSRS